MSYLPDSITLDKISIPGTHDSGTALLSAGLFHTQNFNISRQLADGIRFLDIRVKFKKNNPASDPLQIYHGSANCKISLGNVLDACNEFLGQNTKESIIMLMNAASGDGHDIQQYFSVYLNQARYKDLFYLNPVPSVLSKLREKVILFRRFPIVGVTDMGVDLSQGWMKNKTFELKTPQGVVLHIEDEYQQHNTHKKMKVVESNINGAITAANNGVIFITYNSVSGSAAHTPYQYAWGGGLGKVDPKMNPGLQRFLQTKPGKQRFGIIVLDYYNNETGKIDNSNAILTINANEGVQLS